MRVVTFGELLLCLAAPGYTQLFQKDCLDATFFSIDANIAVSLSIFGIDSVFVTKLPNSDVGYAAAHSLEYFKIDTSKIIYGNGRMGMYYLERGIAKRSTKILYDREYSAITNAKKEEFDWDRIFDGADWFHLTGIIPILTDELAEICFQACLKAKQKGIKISFEIYHKKENSKYDKLSKIIKTLMKYVDVCICNEDDAEKVLGIEKKLTNCESDVLSDAALINTAEMIYSYYGCKYIAMIHKDINSENKKIMKALLYDAETLESYFSNKLYIQIVEQMEGNDNFIAGLIYALENGMGGQDTIEFAAMASSLKQAFGSTYDRTTVKDIENQIVKSGNGSNHSKNSILI